MGFYGNMNSINKSAFQFDKVYSNKTEMDENCSSDGVYVGRYVLIDYDSDYGAIVGYQYIEDNVIKIYSGPSKTTPLITFDENDSGQLVLVLGEITEEDEFSPFKDENEENEDKEQQNFKLYIVDDNGNLTEDFSGIKNNTNYQNNYTKDKNTYGNIGRGWDSTVWQKTYKNGSLVYVMVAELNSAIPTFDVAVDAPTPEPNTPYWDAESSNLYYKLHLQPSWGMRVKDADQNEPSDKYRTVEIESEEGGEPTVQNIRQAIYWNQAGFDKNAPSVSEVSNSITISPAASGALYGGVAENDTYEISVLLPEIGNIMSKVWDIIYGTNRNTHIGWDDPAGASAYRPAGAFNKAALDNVAGAINSVHDLMGMIIDEKEWNVPQKEESETDEAFATRYQTWWDAFDKTQLEDNKIYHSNGKFYFKNTYNKNDQEIVELREMDNLGSSLSTLHGLILNIYKILQVGNTETRDLNTVQGALNELQAVIGKYRLENYDDGLLAIGGGDLHPVTVDGDSWIEAKLNETNTIFTVNHLNVSKNNKTTSSNKNSTVAEAEDQDGINKNQNIYDTNDPPQKIGTTEDQLKLSTIETDDKGHVIKETVETVTLPYGFKTIKAINNSGNPIYDISSLNVPSNVSNDLAANSTKDEITFKSTNNWIKLDTSNEKTLQISHKLRDNYAYSKSVTNFNNRGNSFEIPDWGYDQAGHITQVNGHSYILPSGFKTIQVGEDSVGENNETIAAPTIVAANPIDTLKVESGNYVIPTVDNGKLKFDISFDNVLDDLKKAINDAVHEVVYRTEIESNFWGIQVPIVGQSFTLSKNASTRAITSNVYLDSEKEHHVTYGFGDITGFYELISDANNNKVNIKIKEPGIYRVQASLGLGGIHKSLYTIHIRIKLSKDNGQNWSYICGTTESFDGVAVAESKYPVFGTPFKLIELEENDLIKLEFEFTAAKDVAITQALLKDDNSYLSLEKVESGKNKIKFMFFNEDGLSYNEAILAKLPNEWKYGNDLIDTEKLINRTIKKNDSVFDGSDYWYFNGWQQYEGEGNISDIISGQESITSSELGAVIDEESEIYMNYNDILLVGSWSKKRNVSYQYIASTENFPEEQLVAPDRDLVSEGKIYTLKNLEVTSLHVDGSSPGTWTFKNWTVTPNTIVVTNNSFEMPASDVTITGIWEFTEDEYSTITYSYDNSLPSIVQNTLPNPNQEKIYFMPGEESKTINLPVISSSSLKETVTEDTVRRTRYYSFQYWEAEGSRLDGTITIEKNTETINITGLWGMRPGETEYATEIVYSPSYQFPTDFTNESDQQTAINALTARRTALLQDVSPQYLFYEDSAQYLDWDDEKIIVTKNENGNETILGVWTFSNWNPNSYTSNIVQDTPNETYTIYDVWEFSTDLGGKFVLVDYSDDSKTNYLENGAKYIIAAQYNDNWYMLPNNENYTFTRGSIERKFPDGESLEVTVENGNNIIREIDNDNIDNFIFEAIIDSSVSNSAIFLKDPSLQNYLAGPDVNSKLKIQSERPSFAWFYKQGVLWLNNTNNGNFNGNQYTGGSKYVMRLDGHFALVTMNSSLVDSGYLNTIKLFKLYVPTSAN